MLKKLKIEEKLFYKKVKNILSIDEVGRGCLAGPFWVGGLCFNISYFKKLKKIDIKDSKKLNFSKREKIFKLILKTKPKFKIIKYSNKTIDKYGISYCFNKAVLKLVKYFNPDMVLIDGKKIKFIKNKIKKVRFIIKGDEKTISIGAISIITKYLRDIYMIKISKQINNYFLDKNKGYGSKEHIKQLKIYGPSKIHRLSFIKNFYKF